MLWFDHSPQIRTIRQFTFHSISSRLSNLLQDKNFLVLSSSVESYYKTEFLIFLADVIVNSGFPNFTNQNNSSDLLLKVAPMEEGIENGKEYCFFLVLITNFLLKLVFFFFIYIVLGP